MTGSAIGDPTWEVTSGGRNLTLVLGDQMLRLRSDDHTREHPWTDVTALDFPTAYSMTLTTEGHEPLALGFMSTSQQRDFRARATELLDRREALGEVVPPSAPRTATTAAVELFTLPHAPGRVVVAPLGPVMALSVISRNFLSDFGSDLKSAVGGSLGGIETGLERAFEIAATSLANKASALGADSVIGVAVALESVSDKAQAVMLTGTAVRTRPVHSDNAERGEHSVDST